MTAPSRDTLHVGQLTPIPNVPFQRGANFKPQCIHVGFGVSVIGSKVLWIKSMCILPRIKFKVHILNVLYSSLSPLCYILVLFMSLPNVGTKKSTVGIPRISHKFRNPSMQTNELVSTCKLCFSKHHWQRER